MESITDSACSRGIDSDLNKTRTPLLRHSVKQNSTPHLRRLVEDMAAVVGDLSFTDKDFGSQPLRHDARKMGSERPISALGCFIKAISPMFDQLRVRDSERVVFGREKNQAHGFVIPYY